jgi:hypothetical protein
MARLLMSVVMACLLGAAASASPCGHCDAGVACGMCLRKLEPDECPNSVRGIDNGGLPACERGTVAPGRTCEGDGVCGTRNQLNNCQYLDANWEQKNFGTSTQHVHRPGRPTHAHTFAQSNGSSLAWVRTARRG